MAMKIIAMIIIIYIALLKSKSEIILFLSLLSADAKEAKRPFTELPLSDECDILTPP
jgi:hypothetical protein